MHAVVHLTPRMWIRERGMRRSVNGGIKLILYTHISINVKCNRHFEYYSLLLLLLSRTTSVCMFFGFNAPQKQIVVNHEHHTNPAVIGRAKQIIIIKKQINFN